MIIRLLLALSFICLGCSPQISSYALVGEDYEASYKQHMEFKTFFEKSNVVFNSVVMQDTLLFTTNVRSQPLESIALFQNDTCYTICSL